MATKAYVGISKINSVKNIPLIGIEIMMMPSWANLASVTWGIFNFTFAGAPLDDLAKSNRAWLYKYLKNSQFYKQCQVSSVS